MGSPFIHSKVLIGGAYFRASHSYGFWDYPATLPAIGGGVLEETPIPEF